MEVNTKRESFQKLDHQKKEESQNNNILIAKI